MTFAPQPNQRLHERGDFYGPNRIRLPESLPEATDGCILHRVGRYCICEVHNSQTTRGLTITGEGAPCTRVAKAWNDLFRGPDLWSIIYRTGKFPASAVPTRAFSKAIWQTRTRLWEEPLTSWIVATMLKEIRRHTDASYKTIAWMMATYPELYKDPSWLTAHKTLGVEAPALAAAKHFDAPEVLELQRMAPVSRQVLFEIGTEAQKLASQGAVLDRREAILKLWIEMYPTQPARGWNRVQLSSMLAPYVVSEQEGTMILANHKIALNDEIYLMLLDIHKDGRTVFGPLLTSAANDPEDRLERIFQWKRAGWSNQEILDEIQYAQAQDPEAYLEDPPGDPPEPGLLEANAEAAENPEPGIRHRDGIFDWVELWDAGNDWWRGIEVESDSLEADEVARVDFAVGL